MIKWLRCGKDDVLAELRKRSARPDDAVRAIVEQIIRDVETRGDDALLENARRFDAPDLSELKVRQSELEQASVEPKHYEAIRTSLKRIAYFHTLQLEALTLGWPRRIEASLVLEAFEQRLPREPLDLRWASDARPSTRKGEYPKAPIFGLGQRLLSLQSVGVYVPGGNAAYPSSVLMNAIPAAIAQVPRIVVTSPARQDGSHHPAVLLAAREVGIHEVMKCGGAAAIAALAFGTESIERVDKVVGPGNQFVNEAKRQLWGTVGVDGYAGSSEVCVVVDESSQPRFAALDLLTQLEHAPDNTGFLVSTSQRAIEAVLEEVEQEIETHAVRKDTLRAALRGRSRAILARTWAELVEVVAAIAPEHLSLATEDAASHVQQFRNAGCLLIGEWSPESGGDYVFGGSHTLPTLSAARWQSPVNVMDFLKFQTVVNASESELRDLRPTIEAFGDMEGFPTHARGATVRFEKS